MDNAFKYAETHKMETESDYPYTARTGTCKAESSEGIFEVSSYSDVTHNSASQLMAALNKHVVSVAIEADK